MLLVGTSDSFVPVIIRETVNLFFGNKFCESTLSNKSTLFLKHNSPLLQREIYKLFYQTLESNSKKDEMYLRVEPRSHGLIYKNKHNFQWDFPSFKIFLHILYSLG